VVGEFRKPDKASLLLSGQRIRIPLLFPSLIPLLQLESKLPNSPRVRKLDKRLLLSAIIVKIVKPGLAVLLQKLG
jgi:hypothetical protein